MLSKFLIVKSFSLRHNLQLLISDLPLTRLAMKKLTVGTVPLSFNSQCWELKCCHINRQLLIKVKEDTND